MKNKPLKIALFLVLVGLSVAIILLVKSKTGLNNDMSHAQEILDARTNRGSLNKTNQLSN